MSFLPIAPCLAVIDTNTAIDPHIGRCVCLVFLSVALDQKVTLCTPLELPICQRGIFYMHHLFHV